MIEDVVVAALFIAVLGSLGILVVFVVGRVTQALTKAQESGAMISAKVIEETLKAMQGPTESVEQLPGAPEITDPTIDEPPFYPDHEFDPNLPGALESIADGSARWAERGEGTHDGIPG